MAYIYVKVERSDVKVGRSDVKVGRSDVKVGRSDVKVGRSDEMMLSRHIITVKSLLLPMDSAIY